MSILFLLVGINIMLTVLGFIFMSFHVATVIRSMFVSDRFLK